MDQLAHIDRQLTNFRGSRERLLELAIGFHGSLNAQRDSNRILLVKDPASQQRSFYEFLSRDVLYIEEQPSVASPDGSMVAMVRVWVRKGATALRMEPFYVQDTAGIIRDFS